MSATDRKLAAQGIRAVCARQTLSPEERRLLQANPTDIPTIQKVLESYELANPFHAQSGDIPLGLRRVIRLLTKDQAK